ncbi:MAG TPA: M17 family metallopeptidase [Kofleriaceae bacterium]|jgi:leucyl aminopeptidase|nr:M17 family metallopeptidase [Kofleriaceae bacterium]
MAAAPELPLSFTLHATADTLPAAPRLKLAGAEATLELAGERAVAHLALPARARSEQRWVADQLVRKLTALVGLARADLRGGAGVDDDALLTVGLDLHQRTRGAAAVIERPAVSERMQRAAGLEDGVRAWVDEDADTRTSLAIARDVSAWAGGRADVHAEVLTEEELGERGLRLLLAVGRGSRRSPPRLVLAHYTPGGRGDGPLMLLGKGITFDSGGINLKPYESYVSMMKNDMAGAATAFHLFRGLVEAGHPEPLLLVLPTCENAIGPESMKPGQVVQSYRGPTVRIDHTDAEGRLVLADGLAYACDRFAPRQVLCFATLTTAALIAYGPYATPVHFAGAELERRLAAAAAAVGEDLHFFPERLWHLEANRDKEADLKNTARLPGEGSKSAGSRNAAHFFKHFTQVPFTHFDIFATAWNWGGDYPGAHAGATGAPLRTLLRAFDVI